MGTASPAAAHISPAPAPPSSLPMMLCFPPRPWPPSSPHGPHRCWVSAGRIFSTAFFWALPANTQERPSPHPALLSHRMLLVVSLQAALPGTPVLQVPGVPHRCGRPLMSEQGEEGRGQVGPRDWGRALQGRCDLEVARDPPSHAPFLPVVSWASMIPFHLVPCPRNFCGQVRLWAPGVPPAPWCQLLAVQWLSWASRARAWPGLAVLLTTISHLSGSPRTNLQPCFPWLTRSLSLSLYPYKNNFISKEQITPSAHNRCQELFLF